MKQFFYTLTTLTSHWRRRPGQFAALFVGLAVATALWSGVAALNDQARRSYDRAAGALGLGGSPSLVAASGGFFAQDAFIALRRAGWKVSPILEGTIRLGDKSYRLLGVEPLTLPKISSNKMPEGDDLNDFLGPPGRALIAPQTLRALGLMEGATPTISEADRLPPLAIARDLAPGMVVVDIGAAQRLLHRPGRLSRLLLAEEPTADAPTLESVIGETLRRVEADEAPELAKLTESFHLNLTAFGLLAYVVGLFIAHASFGLAFEQRLPIIRTLRAIGASLRALSLALVAELTLLALLAGAAGMAGGYLIAAALLPNMAASLEGLYGAELDGALGLAPSWWLSGIGMALIGAAIAAASGLVKTLRLPVLAIAQPFAWREAQRHWLYRQAALAVLALMGAAAALLFGEGMEAGFASMAGLLLGAALALPLPLAAMLRLGERRARGPLAKWFFADALQQLPGLSLALMALLLALSTNIGVGSMVEGFRRTFTQWLDERLVAEIYFEAASDKDARRIATWLSHREDVAAVLPLCKAKTAIRSTPGSSWPVEIVGAPPHETFSAHFPLLEAHADAWNSIARGDSALISEQLARRLRLALGSTLEIPTPTGDWRVEIVGIYPDYGAAKGQLRVDHDALSSRWPDARRLDYMLRARSETAPEIMLALQAEFGAGVARIIDQAALKQRSTDIFERTFAVTAALDALTLVVSAIALFASLTTLAAARVPQLAPLWAAGVSRRSLALLELARVTLFAAATALVSVPLGLALAYDLVAIVNVRAFGWRLPFHIFPSQWLEVFALALLTAALAALLPIRRLARIAPASLLAVFANER
ncbi:ABC transporter permease [Methylosinus sp. R-45379]|uniref:ABC transporter permease n=1 Tax=Methylosinus sp. R-45379 TaxID=980563 RepID=UPI0007C8C28C|nr:ABC transporter permease [Methylosinus sp. R-45379]OAI23564.1 ABC transporter permease [Methylosinus sp. R-45379]